MSDIGLAGGITSVSPGFSDLSSAQSNIGFTGSEESIPIYYPGTNIRINPRPTVAPRSQFNLFDLLKGTTAKDIGKTVGDMIVPGRNTPLGIFSVVAKNPTISVMNAIAGAMMNMNKNVQQTTSGLLGGLKDEAQKAKTGPTVDSMYDAFGNVVTAPNAPVKKEKLDAFGEGDFPTIKGAYSQPQLDYNPNEKVQPLNEMMFDAMGMKNQKFAFDMVDPAFEAKDFAPGGVFSVLGKDRSGNIRREVDADGNVKYIDVGI